MNNEKTSRSLMDKDDNRNSISNFSNVLSDLVKLNERFSSIRQNFNKAVSLIKSSTDEKERFQKLIDDEIETIKQDSRKAFSDMEITLKNHEKKQANKSNHLQMEVALLKKEKNELSMQINYLHHILVEIENTIGSDY